MKLKEAWNWELGIGILEDNVFGRPTPLPSHVDPLVEKRREPRISLSLPVRYKAKSGGRQLGWMDARSLDVSRNGVRLALDRQVDVGSYIDLDIKLPEVEKRVTLEGVVVWTNPYDNVRGAVECGIAFTNIRHLSHKEKMMYFMADKICSLAHRNASQFKGRPVKKVEELEAAYRLTYKEYVAKGYCDKHPSQMHYTYYCLLPQTRTFILEKDNIMVGTITVVQDSAAGLPLDTIFPDEINSIRGPKRRLAEVSLLALNNTSFPHKTFSLTDFQKLTATFRLFKIMFDYARTVAGVTDLVIGMHPKHKELYQYLQFEVLGEEKSYPGAQGKPALLMHLDIDRTIQTVNLQRGAGSYFLKDVLSAEVLEDCHHWTPEQLRLFLYEHKEIVRSLKPLQIKILQKYYPNLQLESTD